MRKIMLMDPCLNSPFEPKIGWFLGGIDVVDREETLGKEIRKYNPNDPKEREILIRKYIAPTEPGFTYRHKHALLKVLEDALKDPNYDFASEFAYDYDSDEYSAVAWDETEINDARSFFEDIHRVLKELWHKEIQAALEEDQSAW